MMFLTVSTVPCFCTQDLYIFDVFINEDSNPLHAWQSAEFGKYPELKIHEVGF